MYIQVLQLLEDRKTYPMPMGDTSKLMEIRMTLNRGLVKEDVSSYTRLAEALRPLRHRRKICFSNPLLYTKYPSHMRSLTLTIFS